MLAWLYAGAPAVGVEWRLPHANLDSVVFFGTLIVGNGPRPMRSAAQTTAVLTPVMTAVSISIMAKGRRITANLPEQLLEEAMEVTKKGITETLVEGLRLVRRVRAYEKAMALRGKVNLSIDLDASRERRRR